MRADNIQFQRHDKSETNRQDRSDLDGKSFHQSDRYKGGAHSTSYQTPSENISSDLPPRFDSHQASSSQSQQQHGFNNNNLLTSGPRPSFNPQQQQQQQPLPHTNEQLPPNNFNLNQSQQTTKFQQQSPQIFPTPTGQIPDFPNQQNYHQPPLDFSKPPPGFQGLQPDFSKPPPGYTGPPNFPKPPPGYNGPPIDFTKPPPNFQGPPPNFQGPPPNFSNPRPNFQPNQQATTQYGKSSVPPQFPGASQERFGLPNPMLVTNQPPTSSSYQTPPS